MPELIAASPKHPPGFCYGHRRLPDFGVDPRIYLGDLADSSDGSGGLVRNVPAVDDDARPAWSSHRKGAAVTAPIEAPGDAGPAPEAVLVGTDGGRAIAGRSLGQIAWMRLRRDRVAIAGAVLIVVFVLGAVLAPVIVGLVAAPPNEFHQDLIDPTLQTPRGSFGGVSWDHWFGVEPVNGRDLFSRVVYGSRISLLIAFLATTLSVGIGTLLGVVAGYFGGWVDTVISRLMDAFLAFPLLVFAIALAGVVPDTAFGLTGDTLRIALLVFIIGFFNWPYIGRIIRGQTLSLREREFVDAARSLGARAPHILFRELLPNLVAPILVYFTLLIPTNILFEAALSFLGVGVRPPTATWGGMLSEATDWYQVDPWFMIVPGVAIFVTVLAFNLFGDGLRDALDPRAR
jgi:peptide/nickel transport system permease protein